MCEKKFCGYAVFFFLLFTKRCMSVSVVSLGRCSPLFTALANFKGVGNHLIYGYGILTIKTKVHDYRS